MGILLKKEEKYTYKDYLSWNNDNLKCEIIEGYIYNMSPAPSTLHQRISRKLLYMFEHFLINKQCEVFNAPFDVRLPDHNESDGEVKTVVQPDLLVVCDKNKIDKKGCRGAPDLIIEILSPNTEHKDTKIKYALYENHSVSEYWIVYPEEKIIEMYVLNKNSTYNKPETYSIKDKIMANVLPGLQIELKKIFS